MTALRALALLAALAPLLVAGGSLPHLHASGESGLWNEEHDLSLMAAFGTAVARPDAAPVVALLLAVVLAPVPAPLGLVSAPRRLADPRAPPTA